MVAIKREFAQQAVVEATILPQVIPDAQVPTPLEVLQKDFSLARINRDANIDDLINFVRKECQDFIGGEVQRSFAGMFIRAYLDGYEELLNEINDSGFTSPPVFLKIPKDPDQRWIHDEQYTESSFIPGVGLIIDVRWIEAYAGVAIESEDVYYAIYDKPFPDFDGYRIEMTPWQDAYLGGREELHHAYFDSRVGILDQEVYTTQQTCLVDYDATIHELIGLHALYAAIIRNSNLEEGWEALVEFYALRIYCALKHLKENNKDYESALFLVQNFYGDPPFSLENVAADDF